MFKRFAIGTALTLTVLSGVTDAQAARRYTPADSARDYALCLAPAVPAAFRSRGNFGRYIMIVAPAMLRNPACRRFVYMRHEV